MSRDIKYQPVNWINGMKINKEHFIQQQNAFYDTIRDASSLHIHEYNYGLLPMHVASEDYSSMVELTLNNTNVLSVKVFKYKAVSYIGVRVEILEEQNLPEFSLDINEVVGRMESVSLACFVVLSANPFERKPYGELNAQEEPPRYPYTLPSYKVNIVFQDDINSLSYKPYSFIIGKLFISQEQVKIEEDYIPPCMRVDSHIDLIKFHSHVKTRFNEFEINLMTIVKKIKENKQETSLSNSVLALSNDILMYLSLNQSYLNWEMLNQAPISLLRFLSTSARIIRNSIECNTESDKEELLNYFTLWSELKPGEFEQLLSACINFEYQHYNILYSIEQFTEYINLISGLFDKLASLTYIGKKKETGIFVKEHKTKRSFLAD